MFIFNNIFYIQDLIDPECRIKIVMFGWGFFCLVCLLVVGVFFPVNFYVLQIKA